MGGREDGPHAGAVVWLCLWLSLSSQPGRVEV